MKKVVRITVLLLCFLLAASFVFAGGRRQGNRITLTMVESLTNPERTKVLREIADAYQAEHPNILIEIISPPLDGADQKIQQMLVNKNDMDIFEVRDLTVAQFTSNNFIEPLDDYIKNWSDAGTLVDNVQTTATLVGGKWYLIPYGFYMKMIYYRADWLREAGIPVPTTTSELFAAAKALTNPARGRYGWTLRGISGGWGMVGDIVRARLGAAGINTRDPNYTRDGRSIYGTPEALEAFNAMLDLYKNASPSDAIAWGFQDQCQAFTSGVTGFLYQDPEVVAICQQNMQDGTWATIPLPVDDMSRQYPITTGYAGWGLTSHSKYKQEAADFIMFLSNPENNAKFCKQYSVIPIHRNAADLDPFFRSGPFAPYVTMLSSPENYFLVVGNARPQDSEIDKANEVEYSQVLSGNANLQQILSSWDTKLNAIH
jgi:multiple sugar transport system substrate-binding protein